MPEIVEGQLVYLLSEEKLKPRPKYRVTRIHSADQTETYSGSGNNSDVSQNFVCDLEPVNTDQKLPRPNPYRMAELERLPQNNESKPQDFIDDVADLIFGIDLD
jgi:hypothetical protein